MKDLLNDIWNGPKENILRPLETVAVVWAVLFVIGLIIFSYIIYKTVKDL